MPSKNSPQWPVLPHFSCDDRTRHPAVRYVTVEVDSWRVVCGVWCVVWAATKKKKKSSKAKKKKKAEREL